VGRHARPGVANAPPEAARGAPARAALRLGFVENRGQADPRVRYYARGDDYGFYLTRDEVMLAFSKNAGTPGLGLALRFLDRNRDAHPQGSKPRAGRVNVLTGDDPSAWRTNLRQFDSVVYRDLWPRIDLRVGQKAGVLKYEFRVRPGARPSDIGLAYVGAQ